MNTARRPKRLSKNDVALRHAGEGTREQEKTVTDTGDGTPSGAKWTITNAIITLTRVPKPVENTRLCQMESRNSGGLKKQNPRRYPVASGLLEQRI